MIASLLAYIMARLGLACKPGEGSPAQVGSGHHASHQCSRTAVERGTELCSCYAGAVCHRITGVDMAGKTEFVPRSTR